MAQALSIEQITALVSAVKIGAMTPEQFATLMKGPVEKKSENTTNKIYALPSPAKNANPLPEGVEPLEQWPTLPPPYQTVPKPVTQPISSTKPAFVSMAQELRDYMKPVVKQHKDMPAIDDRIKHLKSELKMATDLREVLLSGRPLQSMEEKKLVKIRAKFEYSQSTESAIKSPWLTNECSFVRSKTGTYVFQGWMRKAVDEVGMDKWVKMDAYAKLDASLKYKE